jgi:hypothetical protein
MSVPPFCFMSKLIEILVVKKGASSFNDHQPLLPIRGIAETSEDVLSCKIREVRKDFFVRHPGSQIFEDIVDSDPHPADTWLPAALTRFDGDDGLVTHALMSEWSNLILEQNLS